MGVNIRELLVRHPVTLKELEGKTFVVDGYNTLYQFLSTIRGRDGNLLTDSKGNVTSHLIGLFSRVSNLMQRNIKLIFVFDGKPPELKHKELTKRKELKIEAQKRYEEALEAEDTEGMKKYAARTSRLTKEMVEHAKLLLDGLGIPWVQAPSEGEAQAVHMVKKGEAYAIASQDYDSLLYGTPILLQNLSVEGRKKVAGKFAFKKAEPLLINLKENLEKLKLTQDQLIWLSMLIGTDYAPKGVPRIGPKKGLALAQKASKPEEIFEENQLVDADWKEVLEVFKTMPVTDDYKLEWKPVNRKKVHEVLVGRHDFSPERVDSTLDKIAPKKGQKGLGDFL